MLSDFDKIGDDGLAVFHAGDEFGFIFEGGSGVLNDKGLDLLDFF